MTALQDLKERIADLEQRVEKLVREQVRNATDADTPAEWDRYDEQVVGQLEPGLRLNMDGITYRYRRSGVRYKKKIKDRAKFLVAQGYLRKGGMNQFEAAEKVEEVK